MKTLCISALALTFLVAGQAAAQNNGNRPEPNGKPANNTKPPAARTTPAPAPAYPNASPGETRLTPEMWFYEQSLRRYQDPKVAVRQAAELRADQRQRRIESMKWFGMSNSRPRANTDPYNNDYSARWTSNDGYYPDRWIGAGDPWVAIRPEARMY